MLLYNENKIRIAGIVEESIVDGPGIRYVVFTQGCPHNCPGCHNPQTHDFEGGRIETIDNIVSSIKENPLLKGITLSGGEPFMQAAALSELVSKLQDTKLNVMTYTGFTFEELLEKANENNSFMELLNKTDILMDGKFEIENKKEGLRFRGSSNQRAIDVKESLKQNKTVLYCFD